METCSCKSRGSAGFSLIEVTLAIAITAIALVGLMGMLPQGLKTLTAAGDRAVEARIHQSILSELMLTPWEGQGGGTSPLSTLDGKIRRYDDQGIQLEGAANVDSTFVARISIVETGSSLPVSVGGGLGVGVKVPGDNAAHKSLKLVVVEIAANSDPSFNFDDPANARSVKAFRGIITKMGQDFTK